MAAAVGMFPEDARPSERLADDDVGCVICFSTHLEHVATLDGCAHSFCTKCIELWIAHRHADPWCPVCRARITGYLTTHRTDPPARPGTSSQTTQLQHSSTHHQQPRTDLSDTASSPPTVRHVDVHPQPPPTQPHPCPNRPQRAQRRRPTTVRPSSRYLCASAEASLRYRVSVYRHGLRAIPPGAPRDTGVPPLASLSDAPRIKSWITRDLQALLGEEDVALLADHARGVLAEAMRRRGQGQAAVDAWAHHQMRPYLGSRVAHFWHELRCFAGCPYTMSTYDRMVRYPAPG